MRVPRLLLLTDRSQLPLGRGLVTTVAACADAGLTHVVVREPDLPGDQRAALAAALAELGVTVLASRKALPAASGVHLASGQPFPEVRPPLLGRSCHSRADVAAAVREGLDYVTLGPVGATASKPGYGPALPPAALAGHALPVLALGGVDPANAGALVHAGAHGVAVMGAVMRAPDPGAVVRDLLDALERPVLT